MWTLKRSLSILFTSFTSRFPADFDNYANNASRTSANKLPHAVENARDNGGSHQQLITQTYHKDFAYFVYRLNSFFQKLFYLLKIIFHTFIKRQKQN